MNRIDAESATALIAVSLLICGCSHVTVTFTPPPTEPTPARGGSQNGMGIATINQMPRTVSQDPDPLPGGFTPVYNQPSSGGGGTSICGQQVSGHRVRFWTNQTPDPGYTKFYAYVRNDNTGAIVPNYQYILQYISAGANGCCTMYGGSDWVTCPVTPGTPYKFTAHFLPSYVPVEGTPFSLLGTFGAY